VELPRADFFSNYPRLTPGGARGIYDYKYGKIILCEGLWCRKTLIHETLHSVSFFSARPDLGRKMLNIVEGLTEFLTGFVTYRCYPYCYSAWKSGLYEVCAVTYPSVVKLWGAFCRFMPITEPAKIYFWDRSSKWETRYSDFLNNIHRAGYPKFGDILQNPKPTMDIKLLQECLKNFGKKNFGDIYYGSLGTCLDFSQMIPRP